MKINFRDGLLYIALKIRYRGKEKIINNVIIDTGASHTIISPDAVEEIGIFIEDGDKIVTSYGVGGKQYAFVKRIDQIKFSSFIIEGCHIDFGILDPEGKINGLLGLDLLKSAGLVIDLKNMLIYEGV